MDSPHPKVLIGVIIFIIIVFVWYFARLFGKNATSDSSNQMVIFARHPNTSTFNYRVEPKKSTENIFYYGEYPTVSECEDKCKGDPKCKAFTWSDDAQIRYSMQCYGRDNTYKLTPELGNISGIKRMVDKSTL
jgi:hypothetical protein